MKDSSSNANVITNYGLFLQGQYFTVAARVLFLWDFFATLDQEVEYMWGSRLSAASVLFFLNRYLNLLITILELIVQAPFLKPQSCTPVVRVLQSLLILSTFVAALFVTLRVYATWSRDWRPALPVLALAMVTPVTYVYTCIASTPIPAPQPSVGCAIRVHYKQAANSIIIILRGATTTACDFLVLLLTLVKTAELRKAALFLHIHPSIMTLLLRDGAVYFILLLVMNVGQIILAATIPFNNWIALFLAPLTSILITRFLLNLRQIAKVSQSSPPLGTTESAIISTQIPSMRLSTDYLGDMAAPLRSGFDWASEDSDETYAEKLPYVDEPLLIRMDRLRPEEIEMERFT